MTVYHKETPIRFINPLEHNWISYLDTKDEANIFHHPAWIELIAESYNYRPFVAVGFDDKGNINAGIPFVEVKSSLTGKRWVSLSFSDHCAPLFDNQQAINKLIQELITMHSNGLIPKLELRWEVTESVGKWSYINQVSHSIALEAGSKNVASKFHNMHKRNIKTAKKRGVEIKHGTSQEFLEDFYAMHLETRSRHGVPIQPKKFFSLLHRNLIEQGLGFISLAFVDGECVAGAVFLHFNKTLVYKYGASRLSAQNYRPNNLIFWQAIEWGIKNGYTTLDLGKTDLGNVGLRNFKSGWGAEESDLIYSVLSKSPIGNRGGFLKAGMEKFITLSPAWVCKATGEILYRHFG